MPIKVLFLCSANSARSLMAEAILRHLAGDLVAVYSAGTAPSAPELGALEALRTIGINPDGFHSKALDDIPEREFDYVISLCDRARSECQVDFKEQHFIAWDFPDPVAMRSNDAFKKTAQELSERIRMFLLIVRKRTQHSHLFNAPQEFFKVLADPLRLQILLLLTKHHELCLNDSSRSCSHEMCVSDVIQATQMSQPKVSRHLAQLREYGLLVDRKHERFVFYSLNPALPDWMRRVLQTTADYNPALAEYAPTTSAVKQEQ
jgi:protein-tyrosine-phosphatase/DNA-binding transcriptional ArsR family regulator